MYLVCHRDLLDDFEMEGYYGNRADALSKAVEKIFINEENAKQYRYLELKNHYGI